MTDRVKLAEARGWTWDKSIRPRKDFPEGWLCWIKPNGDKWYGLEAMPDPENDANDCNALIKHLNRLGYSVHVAQFAEQASLHPDAANRVEFFFSPNQRVHYLGDNWMQGVCELALKVIEKGQ